MTISNFMPFDGQHCETTATGTLLRQIGIQLSEPMLFGIGQGLGFIYWNMKSFPFPFIGGRVKPDLLTQRIAENLQLKLIVKETSSPQKAWGIVKELLDDGKAVGLKLDCFHLQYFSKPFHFAGHYAAIYGYDHENAFLVDTRQQGGAVKTSLHSLALARAEKGPMASSNLCYTIERNGSQFDMFKVVLAAIRNNAKEYLSPPINNIAYKGILKTSTEIVKWFKASKDVAGEFSAVANLMEHAGTGGALFRNFYRDFLVESYQLLRLEQLNEAAKDFAEIARLWTSVSELFKKVSDTKDYIYIEQASAILKELSVKEKRAMEILATL